MVANKISIGCHLCKYSKIVCLNESVNQAIKCLNNCNRKFYA